MAICVTRGISLGALILAIAFYRVWFEKPSAVRTTPWSVAPIATIAVNGDLAQLQAAVALNQPAILRSTGAQKWAVMEEWGTPAALKYAASRPLKNDRGLVNLQEQLPERVSVMSSTGRLFCYMKDAPLKGNFSWPLRAAPVSRLTERPSFLIEWLRMQRNLQPVHGAYFALTQAVTRESTPLVEHSMQGAVFRDRGMDVTRLWVGRGTTTHTHVDESRNFYTQIRGEKTFLLWPPRAHRALRLYPESHPAYRQAQASLADAPPAWNVTPADAWWKCSGGSEHQRERVARVCSPAPPPANARPPRSERDRLPVPRAPQNGSGARRCAG